MPRKPYTYYRIPIFLTAIISLVYFTEINRKPAAKKETYLVERVIDGDTLVLTMNEKVRLIGIDCPERKEPFYEKAKSRLEELTLQRSIELERDKSDKDRFGRLLRYIFIDNRMANEILLEEGLAKAKAYKPDTKHSILFKQLEQQAKQNQRGFWSRIQTAE